MSEAWRRFGWQGLELLAPADWFLTKVAAEAASGELWLADQAMPRLQIKWLDAAKEKSVDPNATLERYLKSVERQAHKQRRQFTVERDNKLISRGRRAVSSLESFAWLADVQSYGVIWYNSASQRVTLAQVNGLPDERGLKTLARRVLGSVDDSPGGDGLLWTAYDLECRVPATWRLTGQVMQTGQTQLTFTKAKDTITISRFGLAEIALARAGDLGDWAHSQRFKAWVEFALERTEARRGESPAVAFHGRHRKAYERFRGQVFNFLGRPYPSVLSAKVWHCAEANALLLVEQLRDPRGEDLVDWLCEQIPCSPESLPPPKG